MNYILNIFNIVLLAVTVSVRCSHALGATAPLSCKKLLQSTVDELLEVRADRAEASRYSKEASFLFFEGVAPSEAHADRWFEEQVFEFVWDPKHGVGAVMSVFGYAHEDLAKAVPPGARILGGTRYNFGMPEGDQRRRVNSTRFSDFDGPSVEDRYFKFVFVH